MSGCGRALALAVSLVGALAQMACGGNPAHPAVTTSARSSDVRVGKGMPPVSIVARDGDPRGAVAVAVLTAGIAEGRGAEAAVALSALVEARLEARGVHEATATAGWDGYRVRALVGSDAEAAAMAEAVRASLMTPVDAAAPELLRVRRRLAALAARPMRDAALLDSVRCTGEAFALPAQVAPGPHAQGDADTEIARPAIAELSAADLEAWRRAAHGAGRVAFATAGSVALGDAVAAAVARGGAWLAASQVPTDDTLPGRDAMAEIYDATGDLAPGAVRVTLSVHTPRASEALSAAAGIGDPRGPLASRLGALDAPAHVRDVTATAHARGGCLAVTLEIAARDLASNEGRAALAPDAPAAMRIATAVALARQELGVEVTETPENAGIGRALARRAGDPREAAERAAWWELAGDRQGGETRIATAIGLAGGRDVPPEGTNVSASSDAASRSAAIRGALDRATIAWHEPVIEARVRVEHGQSDLWILLGSPCGTLVEGESDAGIGAAVALSTARRVFDPALDVQTEGWATPDGIGVIAHAPPLPGETPFAHARRVADVAARRFGADPLDVPTIAHMRGQLLRQSEQDDARALVTLGAALAPGHPSWLAPLGTLDALGRSSDAAVVARASVMRAGPLRLAVLATTDADEADAAVRATDRWIARRPNEARACPVPSTPPPPRPGTYAVDTTAGGSTEAWLALPLSPGDAPARTSAQWLAAILEGQSGLLAHALGNGLARTWSARVVGPARAPSLVVRVGTAPGALDAAVAQTRALLDRVRQGALTEADRARAAAARPREDLAAALEPRARLIALWQGEPMTASPPPLEALRSFAAATLKDDALIIVAVRPARLPPSPAASSRTAPSP